MSEEASDDTRPVYSEKAFLIDKWLLEAFHSLKAKSSDTNAKHVEAATLKLRATNRANVDRDSEDAKSLRKEAREILEYVLAELKGSERGLIQRAVEVLRDEEALPPLPTKGKGKGKATGAPKSDAGSSSDASPRDLTDPAPAEPASAPPAKPAAPWTYEGHASKVRGYSFEQYDNESGMTVTIPVPAATTKADVRMHVKRETLRVTVAGHARQPVVDGALCHPVDHEGCSWSLEGTGSTRQLIVLLEKEEAGLYWPALVVSAEADEDERYFKNKLVRDQYAHLPEHERPVVVNNLGSYMPM